MSWISPSLHRAIKIIRFRQNALHNRLYFTDAFLKSRLIEREMNPAHMSEIKKGTHNKPN